MGTDNKKSLGIYIHIPFCISKCFYCDFLSFDISDEKFHKEYISVLTEEIEKKGKDLTEFYFIDSIFIGGGTPTFINEKYINDIFEKLYKYFDISSNSEITIESNPKTLTDKKLLLYKNLGINRISLGCQSLDDNLLKIMGRSHKSDDFFESYNRIRNFEFDNVNFDMIAAIPGQSEETLMKNLDTAIALKPEHISLYTLQIEEGTVFYDKFINNELPFIDADKDRKMYHESVKFLGNNGYKRYEISNFSIKGKECKHNLKYWSMDEYCGMGLGAHSYLKGKRIVNEDIFFEYIGNKEKEDWYVKNEHINSKEDDIKEYMITSLRKIKGFSKEDFYNKFDIEVYEVYGEQLDKLIKEGMLIESKGFIALSDLGIDVSNSVLCEFV